MKQLFKTIVFLYISLDIPICLIKRKKRCVSWDRAVSIATKSTEISEDEIAWIKTASEGVVPLFTA
jgi:hypothetical protein